MIPSNQESLTRKTDTEEKVENGRVSRLGFATDVDHPHSCFWLLHPADTDTAHSLPRGDLLRDFELAAPTK